MDELRAIAGAAGITDVTQMYGVMPQQAPTEAYSVANVGDAQEQSFQSILDSAIGLVEETNTLINTAENEQIKFELGLTDNPSDLAVAQQKASMAMQYTAAVRDRFIESYNTIMNMQI